MFSLRHNFFRRAKPKPSREFHVQRPLVILQSDDWGRVGVRDQEGYELLRGAGLRLGEHPYDFYTLETAGDLVALRDLLKRHRDSTGRSACMVMNFVMSNLNFGKMSAYEFKKIELLPLSDGLPGNWKRDGLFEAYQSGINEDVFFPSLHGLTHFCSIAVENALSANRSQAGLLQILWRAETPYIYWRMPWVGYEFQNPEKPHAGFISAERQRELIREGIRVFRKLFSRAPVSACAPGYRSNSHTRAAWSECGIRVSQNGSGSPHPLSIDEFGILNMHRTLDLEPSQKDLPLEKYMQLAENCFARGVPAIISIHSINFHSTLKDFRTTSLSALDQLLTALERKFPNLLYIHDGDAYDIVTQGKFRSRHGMVSVKAIHRGDTKTSI